MKNFKKRDLSNEFYKMNGTRDMYTGTSFKVTKWAPDTFYAHDDNIIDFVIFEDCLLYCKRSHWSSVENSPIILENDGNILGIEENPHWEFVHGRGIRGKQGEKGNKGDKGDKGDTSIEGHLSVTAEAYESDTPEVSAVLENNNIAFTFGLKNGSDGKTAQFKIENDYWYISYDGQNWTKLDKAKGDSGKDGLDGKDGISPNTSFKSIVFTRTNSVPNKPSGGSYASPIPDGWSDGIPSGTEKVWMSSRILSSDGKSPQQSEWTDPKQMTDTASFDVEFSSAMIPGNPDTHPDLWSNIAEEGTLWMATRTCSNGVWSNWNVNKIKGETGDTGPAGKGISDVNVAFGISQSSTIQPQVWEDDASNLNITLNDWLWSKTTTIYSDETTQESIVCISKNGVDGNGIVSIEELYYLHDSWQDSPSNDVEWTATRPEITSGKYIWIKLVVHYDSGSDKIIGPYCSTGLQGEKGQDGPGTEYVFRLSSSEDLTEEINSITTLDANQLDDWHPTNWSDHILEPTSTQRYVWTSIRRRKNGNWGKFETPVIWSRYVSDGAQGEHGDSSFSAYAFTRTNENISDLTVVGGNYDNPIPNPNDSITWTDSIPEGSSIVWMVTNIFHSDQIYDNVTWSKPRQLTDTSNFNVEYSTEYSDLRSLQTYYDADPINYESDWRLDHTGWTDNATNAVYMATCSMHNGIWTEWSVNKIKGEDGQDGTSIKIKGYYSSISEFETEWLIDGNWQAPAEESDCYIVSTDLYVWDGDSWENAGQFKGDDGKNQYIHIKYATYDSDTQTYIFTDNKGEVPGPYIGIYNDFIEEDPLDVDLYTWSKWEGQDGFGYEYIYCLTETFTSPKISDLPITSDNEVPVDAWDSDGIIVEWSDNPQEVSSDYPYCWMSWRKKINGEWSSWRGSSTTPNYAILYSRYSKDGRGLENMTEYYLATGTLDRPTFTENTLGNWFITSDASNWSAELPYLWNAELLEFTDGTSTYSTPQMLTYYSGKNIKSITGYYKLCATEEEYQSFYNKFITEILNYYSNESTDYIKELLVGEDYGMTLGLSNFYAPSEEYPYLVSVEFILYMDDSWYCTSPILIGSKGSQGVPGAKGPLIYPAGMWSQNIPYTRTENKVPYVSYKNIITNKVEYYLLIKDIVLTDGLGPDIFDIEYWEIFEHFKAIYADIGVFEQALVGQAVFYGDYMFSQNGIDIDDEPSNNYQDFMQPTTSGFIINDPYDTESKFRPNYCVNLKTGQSWMGTGQVLFQQYGELPVVAHDDDTVSYNGYGKIGNIMFNDNGLTFLKYDDAYAKWVVPDKVVNISDDGTFSVKGPTSDIDDTIISYWELNSDGSGSLGCGSITWNNESLTIDSATINKANITNASITSGKISGFNISGNGLTNEGFDNDAYIICRNDDADVFVGVGCNVAPASFGTRILSRLENHQPSSLDTNYGMYISVQNALKNEAITMNGGCISGFAMKNTIISSSTTFKTLELNDFNVLALNSSSCTITLPQMRSCDDGHVIRIRQCNGVVFIKAEQCYDSSGNLSYPAIWYGHNEVYGCSETFSWDKFNYIGASAEFVWVRDVTTTINGTTYKGAWVVYLLPSVRI